MKSYLLNFVNFVYFYWCLTFGNYTVTREQKCRQRKRSDFHQNQWAHAGQAPQRRKWISQAGAGVESRRWTHWCLGCSCQTHFQTGLAAPCTDMTGAHSCLTKHHRPHTHNVEILPETNHETLCRAELVGQKSPHYFWHLVIFEEVIWVIS